MRSKINSTASLKLHDLFYNTCHLGYIYMPLPNSYATSNI